MSKRDSRSRADVRHALSAANEKGRREGRPFHIR
jgi:hypothetical protein